MNKDWEKIAKEYKKEIENLWVDIQSAIDATDVNAWRRVSILEKSLESSEKAVSDIEKFN
jgi:hypothetical protein